MSRSNPNVNAPNPAVRWFEWNGEHGNVRYYDKPEQKNVDVPLPFTFLLLDELASVRGWHEASESGIYSNEVRDTTKDVLVVKTFKGGTLAEGYYKVIKDRVNTQGGKFNANCYIAAKVDGVLSICSLRFKGAALASWMEFRKAHRSALYEQAVRITGKTEGKKGRVVFNVPTFDLADVTPETNKQATALDIILQAWMDGYLKRKTRDQADAPSDAAGDYSDRPHDDAEGSQIPIEDEPPF